MTDEPQEPEIPPTPPAPVPLVFRCKECKIQPVKLIGAKWQHPAGTVADHPAMPEQVRD